MTITMPGRRRRLAVSVVAVAALLALAACSSPNDTAPDDVAPSGSSSEGFPVTVDTVYGEITLEEKPERIVVLTGAYIDALVALEAHDDIVAFAHSTRAGDDLLAGYPWLEGSDLDLSNHDPGLNEHYAPVVEAIAAHDPDLILGDGAEWAISEELYDQISLIAPTYTSPHGYGVWAWADSLRDVGALTGTTAKAEEAVSGTEAEFDDARERLAGLQGATLATADSDEPATFSLYEADPLYEELGLVTDPDLAGTETLSLESIDQLTSDVIDFRVFRADNVGADAVGRSDLEADPRFADLPAVANGAVLWSNGQVVNAIAESGPLAVSWWLDWVVSQLEDSALNTDGQ